MVVESAKVLVELRGPASLRAVALPAARLSQLRKVVLLATAIHDLGKCSDHFQEMVRGGDRPQLVRHEALSLHLCWPGQPLSNWLRPAVESDRDYYTAIIAAAGHHRKFWTRAVARRDEGAGTKLTLLTGHKDFASVLRYVGKLLGLGAAPILGDLLIEATRRNSPDDVFQGWERVASGWFPEGSDDALMLAVIKALVLPADVAGSVLPKAYESAANWIGPQLATRATRTKLEDLVRRRLGGKQPRPFQDAVADSAAPVTFVRAGCGTGKTVAAYLWAARQHAGRQVWVTYPTTGTATEGYRDYVFGANIEGRLEHSRAPVDVEIFNLRDGSDSSREKDRLDALRVWGAEVVTCTVDTVLGLIQNQRKGLYAWPGVADAVVVFDEIHAYDDPLFGSLLRFLDALPGIPALLMTASLPAPRLAALRALVSRRHDVPLMEIEGPANLETLKRYVRVHADDPWAMVEECRSANGKVLWVSNTVERCRDCGEQALGRGLTPRIYHSRFRYCDRVKRHGDVINAFRSKGWALACTTQVAEMSLDISADLLVTDIAPIPALIQRLGRLNRKASPDTPRPPGRFVVLHFDGLPYENPDLDAAREWLGRLGTGPLSQADLVAAWDNASVGHPRRQRSEWLDGGYRTEPAPVREGSPGITVLRDEDAETAKASSREALELALPMPTPPRALGDWKKWPLVRYVPKAPASAIEYDPMRGARWQK